MQRVVNPPIEYETSANPYGTSPIESVVDTMRGIARNARNAFDDHAVDSINYALARSRRANEVDWAAMRESIHQPTALPDDED